jgi:uncharacterized protein (DUF1786 family)
MTFLAEPSSKAFLIDIGTGTRDILLFSEMNSLENNAKIVAPTATRKMANAIRNSNKDLKISGHTMGGGSLATALSEHIKRGFKIEIEPSAAFTVRNNIEQLQQAGFIIKEEIAEPDLFFDEIELPAILEIFSRLGEETQNIGLIGLSVQDHGDHKLDESSRRKRFSCFIDLLGDSHDFRSLIFTPTTLPPFFTRMRSGLESVRKSHPAVPVVLMDTCVAAVAGCCFDEKLSGIDGPVLYVNFGNGHTLAMVMDGQRILSLYEHHTGMIKDQPDMIDEHLHRLVEGQLDFEEVFSSGGHGCKTFEPISFNSLAAVVATGPRREIVRSMQTNFYLAAPGGDMMMTGPLGLLKGYDLIKGSTR